jgi:hypothetical protein
MPPVSFEQLSANYRRVCESSNPQSPRRIAVDIAEQIGLCDKNGVRYTREDGFPCLNPNRKKRVSDFPMRLVSEAILGRDWAKDLGLESSGEAFPVKRWLSEEAIAPVGPSFFANVSAWTATIGGLIQGSILEGYETEDFDLVDLFPTRPVTFWQGGERYVDVIPPSEPAPKVGPGEEHPDARMDAMWVEPGPMNKYGHKLTVAKETAFIDITGGQIVQRAKNLGYGLKFRENELVLDVLCGQTNNFKLGLTSDASATGYNTYGATVPVGNGSTGTLGNDITNPMTDPLTTFNASQEALLAYKHPVTGIAMPMANRLTTLVIPSSLQWFASYLTTLGQLQLGSQPASPGPGALGGTFPTGWTTGNNPFAGLFKDVRVSQWLYDRHTRSTTQTNPNISAGLGLSVANARRWYRLDPQRFAARRAAWEATVMDLNPGDYQMAVQGVIAGSVGNIAIQIQVLNPWAVQRNKVA